MNNIRFHEVQPSNNKNFFQGDDLVDFELDVFGRSLVRNSIEISGDLITQKISGGSSRIVKADAGNVFLDKNAGIHSVIENVSCSTLNQGNIENIGFSYPRFCSMMNVLEKRNQDKNNIEDVLEWVYPDYDLSNNSLRRQDVSDGTDTVSFDPSFVLKPKIVFNRTDSNIPFSKTGKMRVSMNLTSDEKFMVNQLTGAGITGVSYQIINLKMRFRSVPDDGKEVNIMAQKFIPLKTTINSSLSSLSLNVPSKSATGCSISFQDVNNEGDQTKNNNQLEKINISGLQFFFNNANTYLNYKLDNFSEILIRGLKSLSPSNDDGLYQIDKKNLGNNENFIIGTDLDGVIDLSENSFEVQIESDINSNKNVYLMFHSIISM